MTRHYGYLKRLACVVAGSLLLSDCTVASLAAQPGGDSRNTVLAGPGACPALTHVRFYPRAGFAARMVRGRFSGSNAGQTTDFQTLVEIKDQPADSQWTTLRLDKPVRFR